MKSHYKRLTPTLLLLSFTLIGFGQQVRLVKDINPDSHGVFSRSNDYYTAVDDKLFFVGDDGQHGPELFSSDGTEEGTQMIKDIYEGSSGADIHGLINHNGFCYFFADDGINGKELWRSDGTESGTIMIADINPGSGDAFFSSFAYLTSINGSLYFEAYNDDADELWVVDENENASLFPGLPADNFHSGITGVHEMDGELYFFRQITFDGITLYRYDGSQLTKIEELGLGNIVTEIKSDNGILYYAVQEGFDDILYSYNRNTNTNQRLFTPDNTVRSAIAYDSKLIYSTNNDPTLYVIESNSTEPTVLMETDFTFADEPTAFVLFNGLIYFYGESSEDGIHRTDGTAAGTELVFELGKVFGDADGIHVFGDKLLIAGEITYASGEELFISDGESLELLADIYTGFQDSEPAAFVTVGDDKVFFVAESSEIGVELWVYDTEPVSTEDVHSDYFSISPTLVNGQDQITISLNSDIGSTVNYQIQNGQGAILENGNLNPSKTIKTSQWTPGLYFLTLNQDNVIRTFKVVKM